MGAIEEEELRRQPASVAARKRAAIEIVSRYESSLKQTAQRYSLCAADAEDAYQRALEILLVKAPTTDVRELIRWTHTVTKHEALAVRRNRERLLGKPPVAEHRDGEVQDWLELIPADSDGPDRRVERREEIGRSREALQSLKPAELRALTLLAEGYSYAEIGAITGFSRTKVNRSLAEGRERFRKLLADSEDGSRCRELRPSLSAFCDGEASPKEATLLREHLRACVHCRATARAYRAAPRAAAALAPTLPVSRSLFERAQEVLTELHSRLPGAGTDTAATQIAAAGGTRGAGVAALAKVLTLCAGTAGGAAACVAAGVLPAPIDVSPDHAKTPAIVRKADANLSAGVQYEPAPPPAPEPKSPTPSQEPISKPVEAASQPAATEAGAVEYVPPAPTPPSSESSGASSGSAAGEFGP